MPEHRLRIGFKITEFEDIFIFDNARYRAPDWGGGHPDYTVPPQPLITTNPSSAIVNGPGRLEIFASRQTPMFNFSTPQNIRITIALSPARSRNVKTLDIDLLYKAMSQGDFDLEFDGFTEVWHFENSA